MKKNNITAWILALIIGLFCAFPALAENGDLTLLPEAPGAESEAQTGNAQAAAFDLTAFDSASQEAFAEAVKGGIRLFDMPGYLKADQYNDISERLKNITASYGQDAAVVMVYGRPAGMSMETYADTLYAKGGFGTDADRSGSLLVIDYQAGEYRIYAQGGAMRYFTDKAIEEISKTRNGGIEKPLGDWDDYGALKTYTQSVSELYAQGIRQDQVNYDPVTGTYDYAYPQQKKPFIKWWQVIVSLLISSFVGFIPVHNVKKQYAMEEEKKAAVNLSRAYRMTAAFVFSALAADRMVDKRVTRTMIPKAPSGPSAGSGPSFGGGQSTMHSSSGGGFHTSGGGSFKGR